MRESKIAGSEPKRRILATAERLIAERGFDAVSVRDITQAAKANVAAVNYHFGSREEIFELIVLRHLTPIHDERLARLEAAERKGKSPVLEELLEAYVRPFTGVVRKSELPENLFLKLLGRMLAVRGDAFPDDMESRMRTLARRFTRALGKCLPETPPDEISWRLHFIDGAIIHLLLRPELAGEAGVSTIDAMLGRVIRLAAAVMREGTSGPATAPGGPQATFDF